LALIALLFLVYGTQAKISDKYCGKKNCYNLLNVTNDASTQEVKKSYRSLSLIYHPDKNHDKDTTAIFQELNHAYEILSSPELRESYDEYLENPERSETYHYYRYYKAQYTPHVDPKVVLATFLVFFSTFQYFNRKRMYENALKYIENTAKFRSSVNQRFEEERQKDPRTTIMKEDIIKELKQSVNVVGGYAPPKLRELIGVQIILLPVTILGGIWFYVRWLVKFGIMRSEYGPAEREYLTRRKLGLSEGKWQHYDEAAREQLVATELWHPENFVKYMKQLKEQRDETYADSGKYKRYQRYMKHLKK